LPVFVAKLITSLSHWTAVYGRDTTTGMEYYSNTE